jgi:hypothetical protein
MAQRTPRDSQVHVRVTADLKKALKMFCVREGTTEQSWVVELLEAELANRAPDLWSKSPRERKRGA